MAQRFTTAATAADIETVEGAQTLVAGASPRARRRLLDALIGDAEADGARIAQDFVARITPESRRKISLYAAARELEKDMDEALRDADTDGDGTISRAELLAYFRRRDDSFKKGQAVRSATAAAVLAIEPAAAKAAGTAAGAAAAIPRPTAKQLTLFSMTCAIPFVAFGFVDNFIMVIAGDTIDATVGLAFGLSTMAAAGLGNTFSDMAGIGLGSWIENLCKKMGLAEAAAMTPAQLGLRVTRALDTGSRSLGIMVGCLLGMVPLLFMDQDKRAEERTMKKIFDDMDKDGNGTVSREELAASLASSGLLVDDDTMAELMAFVDVKKTGDMDFDEFCRVFKTMKTHMKTYLDEYEHAADAEAAVPLDALDSTERRMRQTAAKEAAQAKIAFVKFVHAELY